MAIAIYSRKSKVTETGDSIENQIKLCQDYAKTHFPEDDDIRIYEDEGFSGGNTDRPMFQKLLKDVGNKKVSVLICYRLDRISRNVMDFSATLELLQENKVDFVSIRENFDTASPMGRAMVYISSVFAQLERETIGERIKDNLLEMARTGRYLQAKAPMGFEKEKVAYTDKNGHTKHYNLLKTQPEEKELVQYIFRRYFEHQSVTALETEFLQNGVRTRNGAEYKCITLRRILEHPIYCTADAMAYEHFRKLGCNLLNGPEDFDAKHGIYIYRRFENKNNKITENDPAQWHVGVGAHEPLVDAAVWIKTQELLESRRVHTTRRPISKIALLSGILKCGNCGAYMRPYAKVGERFYYVCSKKEVSKKQGCDMKNIRGDLLDKQIMEDLAGMVEEKGAYQKILSRGKALQKEKGSLQDQIKKHRQTIGENKTAIQNLLKKLALNADETMEAYIQDYIKEMDRENRELLAEVNRLQHQAEEMNEREVHGELVKVSFEWLMKGEKDLQARRNLLKNIIREVRYDGGQLDH